MLASRNIEKSVMTIYGYARGTDRDKLKQQKLQLRMEGCTKIYVDKIESFRSKRPGLNRLIMKLASKDVLVVTQLNFLAYSTPDLVIVLNAVL